jgi:hypothetical protein
VHKNVLQVVQIHIVVWGMAGGGARVFRAQSAALYIVYDIICIHYVVYYVQYMI